MNGELGIMNDELGIVNEELEVDGLEVNGVCKKGGYQVKYDLRMV